METFQFDQNFLERARHITLADMLDSSFAQMWAVSMMSNAVMNGDKFDDVMTAREKLLWHDMRKLLRRVPLEERQELFAMCQSMINDLRLARAKKMEAAQ